MNIAVDLHSHSGYAGGVGKIALKDVSRTMKMKGIKIFGTGDCIFPKRTEELKLLLTEEKDGLFYLKGDDSLFALQSEVIFTTALKGYKNRIVAHHIILFPDFYSVYKMQALMQKRGWKNTIGRPFITTNSQKELEDILFEISSIDSLIEIIPAHIMTPDGIYGSKNNLSELTEFYGDFITNIHAIETGLSADPEMLKKIPDIANLTMISNSDCHSAALNRIGREFTVLDMENMSYKALINAIRKNKIAYTAEFNPAEGRYYLTGHRKGKFAHESNYIPGSYDKNCPICGKPFLMGVRDRCKMLSKENVSPQKRVFYHLIPLTEVIAHSLNLKSVKSKKVEKIFFEIIKIYGSEIALWQAGNEIEDILDKRIPSKTISQILSVKNGNFAFDPPGFDGNYGNLKIMENIV